jgi:hypothetical protein
MQHKRIQLEQKKKQYLFAQISRSLLFICTCLYNNNIESWEITLIWIIDFRLSWWLGHLCRLFCSWVPAIYVCSVTDVSEVHSASVFKAEMIMMAECSCRFWFSKRTRGRVGGGVSSGLICTTDFGRLTNGPLKATNCAKSLLENWMGNHF